MCCVGAEQQWRHGCVLVKQRKKGGRAGWVLTRNSGMGACGAGAERQRDKDVFAVGVDKH